MHLKSSHRLILSFTLLIPSVTFPSLAADTTTQPASQPTTAPATQSAPISANDKDAIEKATDSVATIIGKVSEAHWITSGSIMFIDFAGNKRGDFTAILKVANREALDKAFAGDIAAALDLKKIAVTGKIVKYKGTSQIEIITPDQIVILTQSPTTAPATAP